MSLKISELPAAAALTSADLVPVVQTGTTKKATLDIVRQSLGLPLRLVQKVTQTGTDDPTVTQTLANDASWMPVYTRTGEGQFRIDFAANTFPDTGKVNLKCSLAENPSGGNASHINWAVVNSQRINFMVLDAFGSVADNLLQHTLEIEYYTV